MALHGVLGEYDPSKEDWKCYTERLQLYFTANDVDDATKPRAILLSQCGSSTYQLIRNLLTPAKLTDKSFKDIIALVHNHYQPRPSVIVNCYQFHSRSRKEGESITAYVAELKRLSENCSFGDSLKDMLRDRLV